MAAARQGLVRPTERGEGGEQRVTATGTYVGRLLWKPILVFIVQFSHFLVTARVAPDFDEPTQAKLGIAVAGC